MTYPFTPYEFAMPKPNKLKLMMEAWWASRPQFGSRIVFFFAISWLAGNAYAWSGEEVPPTAGQSEQKMSLTTLPVIAIDVGHSHRRPGAISAHGHPEFMFNLSLAQKIQAELIQMGQTTPILINADGQMDQLHLRVEQAKRLGSALYIAVHHDSTNERCLSTWRIDGKKQFFTYRYAGYSLFTSTINGSPCHSRRLADAVGLALRWQDFTPASYHAKSDCGANQPLLDPFSGVYRYDRLYVLRNTSMPAILVEGGVIVNPDEENQILQSDYHPRMARAIAEGVHSYLLDVGQ